MVAGGEEGGSSILLSAPAWDGRWEEWVREVFPLLETTLVASGLSRTLGIVCFHPEYATPPTSWLATHRFGHMHSDATIRGWVAAEDPSLSERADDETLGWCAAYQRRSPHATINVLWSRQLEVAEVKRRSPALYTRNIERCLAAGREELERAAADERRLE